MLFGYSFQVVGVGACGCGAAALFRLFDGLVPLTLANCGSWRGRVFEGSK